MIHGDGTLTNDENLQKKIRTFETGATRDIADGKLEYSDYISPLCDYNYADYMKGKQYIGGGYRPGNNWQKGIPNDSLLASLTRHTEIVKLLYQGYIVWEVRKDGIIDIIVGTNKTEEPNHIKYDLIEQKTIINELNAIRFNSEALKLYYLKEELNKINTTDYDELADEIISLNIN